MRFRKIATYLTVASLPFAFVSCTIGYGIHDPDPFSVLYGAPGSTFYRGNGMKEWENIFIESPNKSRPDYCYLNEAHTRWNSFSTLNCFERINGSNLFSEDTQFQVTSCSGEYFTKQYTDWECSNPSPTEINDLDSYKKLMRYAGDGSPTAGEEFRSNLKVTFLCLSIFAFLAFPFLLITTLFIYLFSKKEKN